MGVSSRQEAFPFLTPAGMKVAPGCSVEFFYRAQCPFTPLYLVMDPAIGAAFEVSKFRTKPATPGLPDFAPLPVPQEAVRTVVDFNHPIAERISRNSVVLLFNGDCPEVPAAVDMAFRAKNTTDTPSAFGAMLWGMLRIVSWAN